MTHRSYIHARMNKRNHMERMTDEHEESKANYVLLAL
jgi:hypothetical protein